MLLGLLLFPHRPTSKIETVYAITQDLLISFLYAVNYLLPPSSLPS